MDKKTFERLVKKMSYNENESNQEIIIDKPRKMEFSSFNLKTGHSFEPDFSSPKKGEYYWKIREIHLQKEISIFKILNEIEKYQPNINFKHMFSIENLNSYKMDKAFRKILKEVSLDTCQKIISKYD